MEQGFQLVIAINAALAIFVVTLAFYCGMLVQRVKGIEDASSKLEIRFERLRDEIRADISTNFKSLRSLIQST